MNGYIKAINSHIYVGYALKFYINYINKKDSGQHCGFITDIWVHRRPHCVKQEAK